MAMDFVCVVCPNLAMAAVCCGRGGRRPRRVDIGEVLGASIIREEGG